VAKSPTKSEMRELHTNSAKTERLVAAEPKQVVVEAGGREGSSRDRGVGTEPGVVYEEGCQERHRREEQQNAETDNPLPVGAKDTPDLACVPDQKVGSLGIGSAPRPDKNGSQDDKHRLKEP
jgi:hypothetical protein